MGEHLSNGGYIPAKEGDAIPMGPHPHEVHFGFPWLPGERERAARKKLLIGVMNDLGGSYNEDGIRRWFQRPRTQLGGLTPAEVLDRFELDSPEVQAVARLARELAGP